MGGSVGAVDGDLERSTDLTHAVVAESAESLDEHADGRALHRVEVDGAAPRNRVFTGLEYDLASQLANRRGARSDQRATQPRDGRVTGDHHHRAANGVGWLAPPDLSSHRL